MKVKAAAPSAYTAGAACDVRDCVGIWREATIRSVLPDDGGFVITFTAWNAIFDETLERNLCETRLAAPFTKVENWRPKLVVKDRLEYRRDDALWYWATITAKETDELTLKLDSSTEEADAVVVVAVGSDRLAPVGTHKQAPRVEILGTGSSGISSGSSGYYSKRVTAEADLQEYRDGYPTALAAGQLSDAALTANVAFQRGEASSTQPESFAIADFHAPEGKWARDYTKLEAMHSYIQWLFPISEKSPFNAHAQPLQRHEIATIASDAAAMANVRRSFDTMLDFFGMRLVVAEEALIVERHPERWTERYANLNLMSHNYLRITRMCKFLGEVGLSSHVEAWIAFLICEVYANGQLPATRSSLKSYWCSCVRDDARRAEFAQSIKEHEAYLTDPVLRALPASATLSNTGGDVGLWVDVWWALDAQWYRGRVSEFSKYAGTHTVVYVDGETRKHKLGAFPLKIMAVVPRQAADDAVAARGGARHPPTPEGPPPRALDLWGADESEAGDDAPAAAEDKELYDVGDVVVAVAIGEAERGPRAGVIAESCNSDGSYAIKFDDGTAACAGADAVHAALEPFPEGAVLKAKRTPQSAYFAPASVVRRNPDGRYVLEFSGYPRTTGVVPPTSIDRYVRAAPQPLDTVKTWAAHAAGMAAFVPPPLKITVRAPKLRTRYSKPTGDDVLTVSSANLVRRAARAELVAGNAVSALWNPLDRRLFEAVVLDTVVAGEGDDDVRVAYADGDEKRVPLSWVCPADCASTDVASHRPVGGPARTRAPRELEAGDAALLWTGPNYSKGAQQWRPCVIEAKLGGGASVPEGIVVDARKNAVVRVWKGDITRLDVDAVQNAANTALAAGGGICGSIHKAAGPQLQQACYNIAEEVSKKAGGVAGSSWGATRCREGGTKITPGFDLHAKWVLHTVGPTGVKPDVLRSAYRSALDAAVGRGCKSIALCAISTGIFGYAIDAATPVALEAIRGWLDEGNHATALDAIVLCLFTEKDVHVYEQWLPLFFPIDDAL